MGFRDRGIEIKTAEQIDRMRHSATRSLLERDDVIIVASVSCIYGIGSVETYSAMIFDLKKGEKADQRETIRKLVGAPDVEPRVRVSAMQALVRLWDPASVMILEKAAANDENFLFFHRKRPLPLWHSMAYLRR